jgi:HAD superfamily hydrolase (TIGR01509 family)
MIPGKAQKARGAWQLERVQVSGASPPRLSAMDAQPGSTRQLERILLVGMMGSGKTTVGELLARRLGVPYVDNDAVLAAQTRMSPDEILKANGVESLRRAEAKALSQALAGDADSVVGVAAGAVLDAANRSLIRGAGRVVWLRGRPETLIRRSAESGLGHRPRFAGDMAGWIKRETEARAPLYAEVATEVVDVDERSPDEVADAILDAKPVRPPAPTPPASAKASAQFNGPLPGPFRAVVFDLDGLLVETETIWMEAKVRLFGAHGVEFTVDDHRAVLGTSEDFTARTFLRRFGMADEHMPAIVEEYLGLASGIFAAGVATREGATDIIGALRGRVPLGLASNTRRELVELILERAGLTDCFEAIVTGDEARPKPEPDIYALACSRLGVAPADAVAVEDSPTGVRAAKAAGMACIAVPSDHEVDLSEADRVVPSLLDLLEPRTATA